MNERKQAALFWSLIVVIFSVVSFSLGVYLAPLFTDTMRVYTDDYAIVPIPKTEESEDSVPVPVVKVCLNTATAEELTTIPGIGPTMAQRIIEYRDLIGSFNTLEQLMYVQGVGETRYKQWLPYLSLN